MKQYLEVHPWKIIENGFHKEKSLVSESLFSLGNGRMGQRGNFEEKFSGKTLLGNYFAGVYYPDKTRVGWWKNGYPEYFAKVLNGVNWVGINITVGNQKLDIANVELTNFQRILDMQKGLLSRKLSFQHESGAHIQYETMRFISMHDPEVACVKVNLNTGAFNGEIKLTPYLDFDVVNQDSNYDEKFWISEKHQTADHAAYIQAKTKKTAFHVGSAMRYTILKNGKEVNTQHKSIDEPYYVANSITLNVEPNDAIEIIKYVAITTSRYLEADKIDSHLTKKAKKLSKVGYGSLFENHMNVWAEKWKNADVQIEGDDSAQQGIRFNIFQLFQTYTGDDARLNIGPKGFTGEKYGGSTYWDTEAYCLPFYLGTCDQSVGYNLLKYRYNHLPKAIENAEKLGFNLGAALYPMVTMNGEECHNEWEITFEEIHRNGAMAYAIFNYIRYTGEDDYLKEGGLEVLIAIARFWKQRFHLSPEKNKYVMLGVTGPNEYENNVNNNWYTNYIARWCMQYAAEQIHIMEKKAPDNWKNIKEKSHFTPLELEDWSNTTNNVFLPTNDNLKIFLQQDGYLDKEQILVEDLEAKHRPLNQKWSWDRILRSCFIKQADVLQGFYFFEEKFTPTQKLNNFEFYEPRTVHESSLSPCIHAILAASLGKEEKAYEMYLRTARLDLDDYNNDTEDGCHITSMAGTWMTVVEGFGGLRIKEGKISIRPMIPKSWNSFGFKLKFRSNLIHFLMEKNKVTLQNLEGENLSIVVKDKEYELHDSLEVSL